MAPEDNNNNNNNKPDNNENKILKALFSQKSRRAFVLSTTVALAANFVLANAAPPGFSRINPIQFIAALGDPKSSEGANAKEWGIWTVDPGPRGVFLKDFSYFQKNNNIAPAGWTFDNKDWWVEEHGLIMEKPNFPLQPGEYLVTGGRQTTTVLEVKPSGEWKLQDAKLFDVTHLPCRAARYKGGSPKNANLKDFPVEPGAIMPSVSGSDKQDYAVIFVIGKKDGSSGLELEFPLGLQVV
eukprot:CAMPEP_0118708594 /NCGR_PEP_ID=MMETSP0800-20121206/22004_1 /TAXON_ID=210618 ORGANISM="Striatella unipunctata, Strain CCMP2910" /NCGR_SAMPLE_ID=MMETSP0800 /ASSEMBLY_ACC=CAM_ASM_000638 /LENGTH=239 /DNA_ID=CAMNT_0006611865 /DNA_START=118 /DNA_END=835 /DNA_ORIENTATION=+